MRIKLAWSQNCLLFPFATAGPPLFPEKKKTTTHILSLTTCRRPTQGSRNRSLPASVLLWSLASSFCGNTLHHGAAVYTRGNKTNVKSKRSVQHFASAVFDVCSQTPSLCSRWNMTYYSVFFSFRWVQGHGVIESASTGMSRCSG